MDLNLPELKSSFIPGQFFRHIDGGYYQYEKSVLFADDQDELVIYQHIWPFEQSTWVRRYSEFKERFTPITIEDVKAAKLINRESLQQQIEDTRNQRRKNRSNKP